VTVLPVPSVTTTNVTIPVTPVRPVMPIVRSSMQPVEIGAGEIQQQAVAQAARDAVSRQGGLAPLIADLTQAVDNRTLPQPIRTAAGQVLAQSTPLNAQLTAPDLAKALARSGLFLEAKLAAEPQASPLGQDMKAGLLVLRQALAAWLAGQPRTPAGKTPTPTPSPPYRAGATRAQPMARPSLPFDALPTAVGQRLASETEAALARQELLQIASLPAPPQEAESQVTRWLFEMPFTTPHGATVAQFEVSRDARGGGEAERSPTWRAAFSIDVEPLGPIHARVSLMGDQAGINLWAERDSGLERLRLEQSMLGEALARAHLRAEIVVHPGSPPGAAPAAGHFVDQTS
jgi:hypothetical protein